MARTLYNLLLCATLALIATLWMRPGLAQDIIDLARNVRFQSPGVAAASPQASDFSTPPGGWNGQGSAIPYSNLPSGPVQPLPATRPASWPGAPLEGSAPAAVNTMQQSAVPVAQPMNGYAPPAGYTPQSGYAPATAYAPPTAYSPPPVTPASNPYAYPSQSTAFLSSPAGAPPVQDSPAGPALAPPQNAVQVPPQNAVQPPPQAGMAMVPQTNADMQSLQVLPGPRQDYEDALIVATVGNIPILASDVRAMIAQAIHNKMISTPPPGHEKELYAAAMRPVLKQMVEMKLVVNDAKQSIPAAGMTKMEGEMNHEFDKNEIPKLMENYGATSQHDLDQALRSEGSSLDWERRAYMERYIFMGWRQQQIKEQQQVPLADVLGYYEQHIADYEFPAQAKWEELMVSFDQFPDKASAYAAVAQMGNQVMQGVPFAEVAKKSSQGPTADKGGAYDWTTQGSLAAKALDENLFKLPVGSLSPILESDRGFHIIRVVERKNAGKKSFEDMQGDIKKQLKEEDRKKQLEKYSDELHKKTPVHTVFDDQPGGLDGPPKVEEHHF